MPKLHRAIALFATLSLLGACCETGLTPYKYPEPPKGSKEAEIEMIQKATALSVGNQAWETLDISNIQQDATSLKWVANTRTRHLTCTADPDGSNAYCDTITPAGATQ
jgi:hypothetical protein